MGGWLYNGIFSIASGSTAQLIATSAFSNLDEMTLDSPINLSTNPNSTFDVYDNLVLNTTLDVGTIGGAAVYGSINFLIGGQQSDPAETLGGTGTIVMGGSASNDLYMNLRGMTIGQNITIEGQSGTVGYTAAIFNQGQILANVGSGTLSIAFGATGNGYTSANDGTVSASSGENLTITGGTSTSSSFINEGTLGITGGGTLSIDTGNNADEWVNTTSISVTSSTFNVGGFITQANLGTVTYSGTTSTYLTGTISSGGLALSSSTGSWDVQAATIDGGTVSATGGTDLIDTTGGITFTGPVTLSATLDMTQVSNASATIQGGMTLNGTIDIGSAVKSGPYGVVNFSGSSQTISGSGMIVFGSSGSNHINVTNTVTLGVTVEGDNGYFQGSGTLDNTGTIEANTAGGTIAIENTSFANNSGSTNGTVEAINGGIMTVAPTTTFSNYSLANGTLTGGTWEAEAGTATGSTLYFPSGESILTDAASMLLDGSATHFYAGTSGSTNVMPNLSSVSGTGTSLTIQNSFNLTVGGSFTDSGAVAIGTGSTFTVAPTSTYQVGSGGSTQLEGGTLGGVATDHVTNVSGTISGTGAINGVVTNDDVFAPGNGNTIGTISITARIPKAAAASCPSVWGEPARTSPTCSR